jgi:hypothetical protein
LRLNFFKEETYSEEEEEFFFNIIIIKKKKNLGCYHASPRIKCNGFSPNYFLTPPQVKDLQCRVKVCPPNSSDTYGISSDRLQPVTQKSMFISLLHSVLWHSSGTRINPLRISCTDGDTEAVMPWGIHLSSLHSQLSSDKSISQESHAPILCIFFHSCLIGSKFYAGSPNEICPTFGIRSFGFPISYSETSQQKLCHDSSKIQFTFDFHFFCVKNSIHDSSKNYYIISCQF